VDFIIPSIGWARVGGAPSLAMDSSPEGIKKHLKNVHLVTRTDYQVHGCPFSMSYNGHLASQIGHGLIYFRNAQLTGPLNLGWPGSDSGSSPSLVGVDFSMSIW
jgi:hypothetical protein